MIARSVDVLYWIDFNRVHFLRISNQNFHDILTKYQVNKEFNAVIKIYYFINYFSLNIYLYSLCTTLYN